MKKENFILKNIDKAPVEKIAEAIKNSEFTLEDAKATGKFNHNKRKQVEAMLGSFLKTKELFDKIVVQADLDIDDALLLCQQYLRDYPDGDDRVKVEELQRQLKEKKVVADSQKEDNEAWAYANRSGLNDPDRINALQGYLEKYPQGVHVQDAYNALQEIWKKIEKLIANIRDEKIPKVEVLEMLKDGRLSEKILVPKYVSKKGLDRYKYGDEAKVDLPPADGKAIREHSTDVYFIGVPNSGKSCLISGLLRYAQNYYQSALSIETINMTGYKYAQELLQSAQDGLVPGSTRDDENSINYIPTMVQNEDYKDHMHPINFIDMSGEHIVKAYESHDGTFDSIPFSHYLKSGNDKYFFIVVDYVSAINGSDQNKYLDSIIKFFKQFEKHTSVLSRTKAINLILTKSDCLDGGTNDEQMAIDFITQVGGVYHNLYSQLAMLYERHPHMGGGRQGGIFRKKMPPKKPKIYPYSLGKFELFDLSYQYDVEPSKKLFWDILKRTKAIKVN